MAMLSPFFADKQAAYLLNLGNETIRNCLHGEYVLVHNHTPSTGKSTLFHSATLRELVIAPMSQNEHGLMAEGSFIRLGHSFHSLHDIQIYPLDTQAAGQHALYQAERVEWEKPRHIGGTNEDKLIGGGVQRIDTEAAVAFLEKGIQRVNDDWLEENGHGMNDGFGLKHLEALVVGKKMQGLRPTGSTITFGFVASQPRRVQRAALGLPRKMGEEAYVEFQEGFEFVQLELAHASIPAQDDKAKGGREVLVFIKMPEDNKIDVSSAYITKQTLSQHVLDIYEEIKQGRGTGIVIKELFGSVRPRPHVWKEWGVKNRTRWAIQLVEGVIDEGARGFDARAFEEIRSSLQLDDSIEVMDYMLQRIERAVNSILEHKLEIKKKDRYDALNVASSYIFDRMAGTKNHLSMAKKWMNDKVSLERLMGEVVKQPKLAKSDNSDIRATLLPDADRPGIPMGPLFPLPYKREQKRRPVPQGWGFKESKPAQKASKQAQAAHKEQKDLDLFQKASGEPLPKGILKKQGGVGGVSENLAPRQSENGGDGDKSTSSTDPVVAAGASGEMTPEQLAEIAATKKELEKAKKELEESRRKAKELQETIDRLNAAPKGMAQAKNSAAGDEKDVNMGLDESNYEPFVGEAELPALPRREEGAQEKKRRRVDSSSSLSLHASVSSYHAADGDLPVKTDLKGKGKQIEVVVQEDTPPSKKRKADQLSDDEDDIYGLGAAVGVTPFNTPVKQSGQGMLAQLKRAKVEVVGQALGVAREEQKGEDKENVGAGGEEQVGGDGEEDVDGEPMVMEDDA